MAGTSLLKADRDAFELFSKVSLAVSLRKLGLLRLMIGDFFLISLLLITLMRFEEPVFLLGRLCNALELKEDRDLVAFEALTVVRLAGALCTTLGLLLAEGELFFTTDRLLLERLLLRELLGEDRTVEPCPEVAPLVLLLTPLPLLLVVVREDLTVDLFDLGLLDRLGEEDLFDRR